MADIDGAREWFFVLYLDRGEWVEHSAHGSYEDANERARYLAERTVGGQARVERRWVGA